MDTKLLSKSPSAAFTCPVKDLLEVTVVSLALQLPQVPGESDATDDKVSCAWLRLRCAAHCLVQQSQIVPRVPAKVWSPEGKPPTTADLVILQDFYTYVMKSCSSLDDAYGQLCFERDKLSISSLRNGLGMLGTQRNLYKAKKNGSTWPEELPSETKMWSVLCSLLRVRGDTIAKDKFMKIDKWIELENKINEFFIRIGKAHTLIAEHAGARLQVITSRLGQSKHANEAIELMEYLELLMELEPKASTQLLLLDARGRKLASVIDTVLAQGLQCIKNESLFTLWRLCERVVQQATDLRCPHPGHGSLSSVGLAKVKTLDVRPSTPPDYPDGRPSTPPVFPRSQTSTPRAHHPRSRAATPPAACPRVRASTPPACTKVQSESSRARLPSITRCQTAPARSNSPSISRSRDSLPTRPPSQLVLKSKFSEVQRQVQRQVQPQLGRRRSLPNLNTAQDAPDLNLLKAPLLKIPEKKVVRRKSPTRMHRRATIGNASSELEILHKKPEPWEMEKGWELNCCAILWEQMPPQSISYAIRLGLHLGSSPVEAERLLRAAWSLLDRVRAVECFIGDFGTSRLRREMDDLADHFVRSLHLGRDTDTDELNMFFDRVRTAVLHLQAMCKADHFAQVAALYGVAFMAECIVTWSQNLVDGASLASAASDLVGQLSPYVRRMFEQRESQSMMNHALSSFGDPVSGG